MINVIIVEDEPAIARGLSLLITQNYCDFRVLALCRNGKDGLQKILELKPDLIFTDISMPGMNGLGYDSGTSQPPDGYPLRHPDWICRI